MNVLVLGKACLRSTSERRPPVKIAHVIHSLESRLGGPPRTAVWLAAAQAAAGNDVVVVSCAALAGNEAPRCDGEEDLIDILTRRGVRYCPVVPRSALDRLTMRSADRTLAQLLREGFVFHLHGVWEPLLVRAARLARRAGGRAVMSPHGMLTDWALRQKKFKKRVFWQLLHGRVYRRLDGVHALNDAEAAELRTLLPEVPVVTAPNGYPLSIDDRHDVGASAAAPLAPRTLVFLGRVHPEKGVDILCRAFARIAARHPDGRLIVAGPDFGGLAAARDAAKNVPGITYVGPIYGPDKEALLARSWAFCLPSGHEASSVAALEALAFGVPVLLTPQCHVGGFAEAGTGIEVARDDDSWASALDDCLSWSLDDRLGMGLRARDFVVEHFSWHAIAKRLQVLYT